MTEYTPYRRQVHGGSDIPLSSWFEVVIELEPQDRGTLLVLTLSGKPSGGPAGAVMSKLMRSKLEAQNRRNVESFAELVARDDGGQLGAR